MADPTLQVFPLNVNPDPRSPAPILSFTNALPPSYAPADLDELNDLARLLLLNPHILVPAAPVPAPNLLSQKVAKSKDDGNLCFRVANYADAIKHYTDSAELAVRRPLFEASVYARDELAVTLCNRSAAYAALGQWVEAKVDADAVISLKKNWTKGYFRLGKALQGMGRIDEAREALLLGLQFEPTNDVRPPSRRIELTNSQSAQDLINAAAEADRQLAGRKAAMLQL